MPIRIQIVTNKWSPVSAAIRFSTRSWASHAEFVDTDKQVTLGARAGSLHSVGGVQIRECCRDHYSYGEQFVLNTSNSEAFLKRAWNWLWDRIGTPYNYRGIIGIATDLNITDPDAMDCSMALHLACVNVGFPLLSTRPSAQPWRITPRDLLLSRGLVFIERFAGK